MAQSVIPVLDAAKIVQVFRPTRTRRSPRARTDQPNRPNANYPHRTTDAVQGRSRSTSWVKASRKSPSTTKVLWWGLVTEFTKAFESGGTVVAARRSTLMTELPL